MLGARLLAKVAVEVCRCEMGMGAYIVSLDDKCLRVLLW